MAEIERLLGEYARLARARVLGSFRPDTCILTTRVLCDTLGAAGLPATPLTVEARLYNAMALRLVATGAYPDTPAGDVAWKIAGAWSVGVGVDPGPDRPSLPIHVVAIVHVGGENYLVDGSLDQAARPAHRLVAGPLAALAPAPFLLGQAMLRAGLPEGGAVFYLAQPGRRVWTIAPDWTDPKRRREIVRGLAPAAAALARQIKEGSHVRK